MNTPLLPLALSSSLHSCRRWARGWGRTAIWLLLATFLAAATGGVEAAPVAFLPPQLYTVPGAGQSAGVYNAQLADMNLDGKLDVVVQADTGRIWIYLGNGDGTFQTPSTSYPFSARTFGQTPPAAYRGFSNGIVVADFNGDGNPDVAACDGDVGRVVFFAGQGNGTLQQVAVVSPGPGANSKPWGIVAADFDHNGTLDFATTISGERLLKIFSGNGAMAFTPLLTLALPGDSGGVSLGDYNADGWPDLCIAPEGRVSVMVNNQQGGFTITTASGIMQSPYKVVGVKYGPTQSAFVVSGYNSFNGKEVQILGNILAGQPSLQTRQVSYNWTSPQEMLVTDLNLDGTQDVIIAGTLKLVLVPGNGNGTFGTDQTLFSGNGGVENCISADGGDLNGDGRPDLVVANANNGFRVLLQRQPPSFTSAAAATFEIGFAGSFSVTANDPTLTFNYSGTLPAGVSFNANGTLSGTPAAGTAGTYPLVITTTNSGQQTATQNFTLTVIAYRSPVVTLPTVGSAYNDVTSSSATLYGHVASDAGFPITRRGVVYAVTSANANPLLGGAGVLFFDDPLLTTGHFSKSVTGLGASTQYSFRAFAINARGTSYGPVTTFQTLPPPGAGSLVVTTTADENNGDSQPQNGAGTSLREAIAYANAIGGNQTITFLPNLFLSGPATITLSLGEIALANLTGTTTLAGPGAGLLTINANGTSRIFNMTSGGVILNAIRLTGGSTNGDGGLIRSYGTLTLNDCVVAQNTAVGNGGAIYNGGGGFFSRTTFTGNSANRGGAIANEGTLWAMNCTFRGNSAAIGGGISDLFASSATRLICSTLTGNTASTHSGGLVIVGGNGFVNNTIISGNTAPASPDVSGTVNSNAPASNLIGADPVAIFTTGSLADNGGPTQTIALKPGGPAVNAGVASANFDQTFTALPTDQRGKPRTIGALLDIGAYETPLPPTLAASSVSNILATSATVSGNVTADGFGAISARGVVFSVDAQNANPTLGGGSVVTLTSTGTTGAFSLLLGGLTPLQPLTLYSFATFATNEAGTTYSAVQTFRTSEALGPIVTIAADTVDAFDGQTSLREAVAYANSVSGAVVTFAPALAGQTVTLQTGWAGAGDVAALHVTGRLTIQGPATAPGVTLAMAAGVQKKHLVVESTGDLTLANLTLTGGSGDYGGSTRSFGQLTIRGCTFTGNSASVDGGAVHAAADSTSLLIENSTFSGNSSSSQSSAIATGALQTTLRHLTVTGNTSPSGAILLYQYPTTMVNCLVAGNTTDGILQLNGATLTAESTNNLLGTGGTGGLVDGVNGNFVGVPAARLYLGALTSNGGPTPTIALQPGSLAVNSGVTIVGFDLDQRGFPRVGAAPDIGAFEDAAGDEDPDRDVLSNRQEYTLLTNPLSIDSDGDGFNDATESLAGSNPNSSASVPAATHLERVLGFGPARGLDLTGNFKYAFNVGTPGAAGQAGDANFTADNAPGITVSATNEISSWGNPDFGPTAAAEVLETVYRSIRWTSRFDAGEARKLKVDLANVVPGRRYKLQLLFGENGTENRRFDILVDGTLVADDFNTATAQGSGFLGQAASALVHEFTASGSTLHIVLDATNVAAFDDLNQDPILNGVTLEVLPTALDAWRTLHSLAADGSQDLANPSGDGIANLLKYAFNLAPNLGDLAKTNLEQLPENGVAGLPFIRRDSQDRLVIEFVRRKAATNPGISYSVETSGDLTQWDTLDLLTASINSIDAVWERVTVTSGIAVEHGGSGKALFARVRVLAFSP